MALEKLLVLPSSLLFLKKATMVWDESEDTRCGVGGQGGSWLFKLMGCGARESEMNGTETLPRRQQGQAGGAPPGRI